MIELKSVSMSFQIEGSTLAVLNDVDLQINAGESVAITGPSGSGKTSLLLLLAGLEKPVQGDIVLRGASLNAASVDQLANMRRDHIGIIFQSFHLVPSLNALRNVALPLEIAGIANAQAKALEMLERVGLASRAQHYPSQLSGGEQQRVAIARALVHGPDLLLADEPTGNLDAATGAQIVKLLFSLCEESGATLVLVTHDNDLARRCDRTLTLTQGKLKETATHAIPA